MRTCVTARPFRFRLRFGFGLGFRPGFELRLEFRLRGLLGFGFRRGFGLRFRLGHRSGFGGGGGGRHGALELENRGIYTQSDSSKKSSRNIWSLAVVSVDQRY